MSIGFDLYDIDSISRAIMTKAIDQEILVSEDAVGQVDMLSDESLMRAYQQGNQSSLGVLIRRYERELFSYLRRMLPDTPLAEDVFQNTFLQIHLKRHLYEAGRPFRPWLYTVATNQAIDALRRNQRHQRASLDAERDSGSRGSVGTLLETLASEQDEPDVVADRKEKRSLVRSAVDRLSEHLRPVVVLSYYQGMKYKEIASVLGIPVGTVKSRLHAAVRRLAEEWESLGLSDPVDE
ncbi:MAG: RNA polymerase sigma factor [Planctomycetota bacterium]